MAGGKLFFRTELLSKASTKYASPSIEDYAARTSATIANWNSMNGKQGGDPAKLADALIALAALEQPPSRFAAGADAVETLKTKAAGFDYAGMHGSDGDLMNLTSLDLKVVGHAGQDHVTHGTPPGVVAGAIRVVVA